MPWFVHKDDDRTTYQELWGKSESNRQELARKGIAARISLRGNSLNGTLFFMGLLAGAEIALIIAGLDGTPLRLQAAFKPAAWGLLFLFFGLRPALGNLFPRHRGPEGEESLQRDECDWDFEAVRRSSAQRHQLWWLRVALTLSMFATSISVLWLIFA